MQVSDDNVSENPCTGEFFFKLCSYTTIIFLGAFFVLILLHAVYEQGNNGPFFVSAFFSLCVFIGFPVCSLLYYGLAKLEFCVNMEVKFQNKVCAIGENTVVKEIKRFVLECFSNVRMCAADPQNRDDANAVAYDGCNTVESTCNTCDFDDNQSQVIEDSSNLSIAHIDDRDFECDASYEAYSTQYTCYSLSTSC